WPQLSRLSFPCLCLCPPSLSLFFLFFFQAEDGIRVLYVTGVQTCALPICLYAVPNLSAFELKYLLGTAYKRFYMRPSYLANFLKIQNKAVRDWVSRMDERVNDRHSREEIADISRPVAC